MKRFFLIPLVAFFACATAWATNPTTAADLQAAVNAATDNVATTITLGGPISSEGTIVSIPSGKVITLDLSGYTLTSTAVAADEGAVPAIVNEGVLHLQGAGSISSPNNIAIYNGASDYLSWFGPSSSPKRRAMARKAMLENDDPTEPWITFSGSFNVHGGEGAVINICFSYSLGEEPSENITFLSDYTGQVTGSVEDMTGTKGHIKVNGGKFSEDISENATIAEEYHIELVDGWYTLVEGAAPKVYVAQVGDTQYESFKEAFEAIYNMDAEGYTEQTVTLLMDVDLAPAGSWDDELDNQINKSVTLDLNGHNITAALPSSYRCIFRMTHYDATLTITGNGQFIMTAEDVYNYMTEEYDSWTLSFNNIISNNTESHIVLNGGSYPVAPVASYMPMGYTASLTDGYYVVAEDNNDPRKLFNDYMTGNSSALFTVSANTDMSGYGPYQITGTKNIEVNSGVTLKLRYKHDDNIGKGSPLYVANGGSLTLTGNGTIVSNNSPIYVVNGGSLTIGATDGSDALNINTVRDANEFYFQKDYAIENRGVATIYNVVMDARSNAIYNRADGEMDIKKATIVSHSTSATDTDGRWAYAVINDGIMSLNNAYVQGIQGAVACESGNGTLDIRNCDLRAYNTAGKEDAFAALYVATNAVVNVYNTDLYSDRANYAAYIGNNDAGTTFGIINLYSGRLSSKMYVQNLKPTDAEFVFPVSIPASSTWYSSFKNYGPLPAGSEYFDIDVDGYKYEVRVTSTDTKEIVDPATTITWQQSSTWKAGESSETTTYVPEETTIVTIPTGKDVVISNDANDNNGMTDAVADQIFVNQGASLTVESGTTLTVGDGGMNIANGGSITVEPGAVVKIGTAGVITTEKDALVLVSNDDKQAALLYDPTVPQSENTQPKATVKLETKSKQIGDQSYVYERFAIPTLNGAETTYKIEGGIPKTAGKPNENVALYNDAPSFLQAVWAWDHNAGDWQQLNSMLEMKPFNGYQLTNNSANGGLVYVFEGNLVGNNNGTYEFVEDGFHFFGNSYSAEINIRKFLDDLASGAEKSVWLYDPYDKTFKVVTRLTSNGRVTYGDADKTPMKDIRSMQAFIMMLNDETNATVNYESAIWGNPKYNPSASPAPARETIVEDWATIKVASANGQKDEFTLVQSEEFSSAFENGADASKFMNKENINLYATTNAGNLAMVATDNIDRTVLAFAAGEATEYTISFEGVEGNEFTLRDIITGAMVSMTEGATYTFTQEANTTNAARFEIIGIAKTPTAIENVEAEANTHGIYTIAGQFVGNDFNALSAGVYVVNGVKIVK